MPSLYTRATGTLLVQIMGYSAIFMLNRLYTRPSFSQILPITCHWSARHFMAAISLPRLALTWRAACHCTNLAHLRTRQPYNELMLEHRKVKVRISTRIFCTSIRLEI